MRMKTSRAIPQPLAITRKYLAKIFSDPKVIKALVRMNNHKGHEAGANIMQLFAEPGYGITPVWYGINSNSLENSEIKEEELEGDEHIPFDTDRVDSYVLISMHSHPNNLDGSPNIIIPSFHDGDTHANYILTRCLAEIEGLAAKPIDVILGQTNTKDIDLLLYQPSIPRIPSDKEMNKVWDELDEKTDRAECNEDVAKIMKESGYYNAEILIMTQKGFKKKSLEKLSAFAFTPVITDEKKYVEPIDEVRLYQGKRL